MSEEADPVRKQRRQPGPSWGRGVRTGYSRRPSPRMCRSSSNRMALQPVVPISNPMSNTMFPLPRGRTFTKLCHYTLFSCSSARLIPTAPPG